MNSSEKPTGTKRAFSLHRAVNELLNCYARVKRNHSHYFINDVPSHLVISSDDVASLLGDLFAIISSHPAQEPVRISAVKSADGVKLYVKESLFFAHCFAGAQAA
ncbi:MAG: hypothetical protein QM764_09220 [Chitinophagaceae bacterium]